MGILCELHGTQLLYLSLFYSGEFIVKCGEVFMMGKAGNPRLVLNWTVPVVPCPQNLALAKPRYANLMTIPPVAYAAKCAIEDILDASDPWAELKKKKVHLERVK